MRHASYWLVLCVLWSHLTQAALPADVQEALTQAQVPADSVAIVVQPVDGGAPLIQHNASKAMNPASVMKLVTTYAALEALGAGYRWKTEVYRNGSLNHGVLDGDLVLKGYGDPALNVPEFWRVLQQVQHQGIQQIKGKLIIDNSAFAAAVSQRPILDNETLRAYNANPSAFLLNGRYTSFRLSTRASDTQASNPLSNQTSHQQAAAQVQAEFALPGLEIINQLQTHKAPCTDWRTGLSYQTATTASGVSVTFSGSLPDQCEERFLELSVLPDQQYMAQTFGKLWTQLGGSWQGRVEYGTLPSNAVLVTTWQSPPLESVIRDINKWSNNVMARQLLLTIGLQAGMLPAEEPTAALALKNTLRPLGLQFPELVLENGAGLSRNERISAEHLAQLLITAYQRPVMPVFMASLPILGVDGTTRRRLADSPAKGMAYLKTGSLEGVSSLAGYVQDARGKRYVLVIIANHPRAAAIRNMQDALLKQLIDAID